MSADVTTKKPGHNAVRGKQGFQATERNEPSLDASLGAQSAANGWDEPTPKGVKVGPFTRRHDEEPVITLDGIEVRPRHRPSSDRYVAQTSDGMLIVTYATEDGCPFGTFVTAHEKFRRDGYRAGDVEFEDDQFYVAMSDPEQQAHIDHLRHLLQSPPSGPGSSLVPVPDVDVEPVAEAVVDERLNEQHPPFVNARGETMFRVHCTNCGEFIDESDEQPASDYLCDECLDGFRNQ